MNRLRFSLGLTVSFFALTSDLPAHAFIDHAAPAVGSIVNPAPASVKLWMSLPLVPGQCRIEVFNSKGAEIDRRDTHVEGATISVSVPPLAPGRYEVKWVAMATCLHRTEGGYKFTVR